MVTSVMSLIWLRWCKLAMSPLNLTTPTSSPQLLESYQAPTPLDTCFRNKHHKLCTKCHAALTDTDKGRSPPALSPSPSPSPILHGDTPKCHGPCPIFPQRPGGGGPMPVTASAHIMARHSDPLQGRQFSGRGFSQWRLRVEQQCPLSQRTGDPQAQDRPPGPIRAGGPSQGRRLEEQALAPGRAVCFHFFLTAPSQAFRTARYVRADMFYVRAFQRCALNLVCLSSYLPL